MTTDADAAASSDLRAAVQYSVSRCLHDDDDATTELTPRALASLSELTYMFATRILAADLDAFRRHAGRHRITVDDVRLVVRRSPELLARLEAFQARPQGPTGRRRRETAALESDDDNDDNNSSGSHARSSSRSKPVTGARRVLPRASVPEDSSSFQLPDMSDSESSVSVAAPAQTSKPPVFSLSSSSDDEVNVGSSGPGQPLHQASAVAEPQRPADRKFRLSSRKDDDDDDDAMASDSDEDVLEPSTAARGSVMTHADHGSPDNGVSLRIQQTLDALGDDSAPSEEEESL